MFWFYLHACIALTCLLVRATEQQGIVPNPSPPPPHVSYITEESLKGLCSDSQKCELGNHANPDETKFNFGEYLDKSDFILN